MKDCSQQQLLTILITILAQQLPRVLCMVTAISLFQHPTTSSTILPNYTRWVPLHTRDIINLSKAHPLIADEFNKGNFTVHRTRRAFSSMAIDQAQEQSNAAVKSDGGAVGHTQSPEALRRWLGAGPEVVRLINSRIWSIH